jgi:hypothetical protein
MMSLDLVIAIDSGLAQLAGALGRPVRTLVYTPPDSRWLLNREDSPWYPTMRLFRQTEAGQWGPVFERVAEALRAVVTPSKIRRPGKRLSSGRDRLKGKWYSLLVVTPFMRSSSVPRNGDTRNCSTNPEGTLWHCHPPPLSRRVWAVAHTVR